MSFVWGNEGPSFEYPTCYRTENQFLTLRAAALFLIALAVLWIALSDPQQAQAGAALLRAKVERGSWVPHLVMSLVLFGMGAADLVRVSRQRRVRLAEGQPAPLAVDLSFHVTGASPGAAWLHRAVTTGKVEAPDIVGSYQRVARAVAPAIAHAPVAVQTYIGVRVSQLLFSTGLLVSMGLIWALASQRPGVPLVAVLFGMLAVAHVVYAEWVAERAPSPLAVGAGVLVAALAGVALVVLVAPIAHLAALKALSLPVATTVLLGCLVASDLLGLLAARGQITGLVRGDVDKAEAADEVTVDVQRLMNELDSELVRRWVDGVPNRRFIRRQPQEAATEALAPAVVVLEESQPTLPGNQRDRLQPLPKASRIWLFVQAITGLVLTIAGGITWVRMADALMEDASTGWARAGWALVLLLVGGYLVRVGHLLWSRIEVESSVHLLAVDGTGLAPGPVATADGRGPVRLRVRVVRVLSMFYAAAEHTLGSRRLLRLTGDAAAAKAFVDRVQSFNRRGPATPPAPAKTTLSSTADRSPAASAGARGIPRFCPACGTPVLQGARFCQNCGNVLVAM